MSDLEIIVALADKGVGRMNAEAKIGRKMTSDELAAFRSASVDRRLRLDAKKARGPKSTAERVREHVAKTNDVGDIDLRVRHPRLKAYCRNNLEAFGWYYCRRVLRHRASPKIRDGLIKDIERAILSGGQSVKQYGRGAGKTTWIVYIAIVWAILYGHRRYPVIISATGKLAKKNLKTIKKLLSRSNEILADFPEIAGPIRELGDVSQRTASQTYNGRSTDIEWSADQIVLPNLLDDADRPLGPGCGAIVGSVGIGGAIRGSNESGQRPDFLVFDDPQTKKIARSPTMVEDVIEYIHQDALQLSGHDTILSAFVTITPQCYGDVACELSSSSKHPEWSVSIEPFMSRTCPNFEDLVQDFLTEYVEDAAAHDFLRTRSTNWYRANREKFAEVEVLDPFQFDRDREVDAVHHILNLRAKLGERSFNAEIMMQVADLASDLSIDSDLVASKVNGAPRGVLPPGTDCAVAFVDLNIRKGKGLSWGVCAFGPNRIAAGVAYGRYPERGPVCAPNVSDLERNRAVAHAITEVVRRIMSLRLHDAKGRRVQVRAVGFDRGYLPDVVHRTLYVIRKTGILGDSGQRVPVPFPLVAVRGFPWNKFGTRKSDMLRRGDHVFATRSQYGEYLAVMAPYWREIMQSSLLETPLMPGSLSFYGSNPVEHFILANEIAAEHLVRKYVVDTRGKSETAWDWSCSGDNHYCDVFSGCFALASWYHCYDTLSHVIDSAAYGTVSDGRHRVQRVVASPHQDDLFDPRQNPAVTASAGYDRGCEAELKQYLAEHPEAAYDGASDPTEGTGELTTEPFPGDLENTKDPLTEADPRPKAPQAKLLTKRQKRVYKFKRGKWRK